MKIKFGCGTFNLIWNDLINDVIGTEIEFEDGYSELAEELNKQTFTVDQLSESSYFKICGINNSNLKSQIELGIEDKFNETSEILDKIYWDNEQSYILYAMLKKEFNYLEAFQTLDDDTFGGSNEKVKYFGIEPDTAQDASKNVDILFYNSTEDFAIKLKTQEGEEVYLYKTTGEGKSFEEVYQEMLAKQLQYGEETIWNQNDVLKIPYIYLKSEINYDELCGRYIKGSKYYISQAIQTVNFELNNYGGSVESEALIEVYQKAIIDTKREFIFNNDFIIYLKEENKEQPYFALKVDNIDILKLSDN